MRILITLLAIFGGTYGLIEPFGTQICRLFGNGVQLRNPGTCQEYITCQNGESTVTDCAAKVYNKETGKCATSTDAYCKVPCTTKSPTWVADPKSCNGYYKCVSGVGTPGNCINGLNFNETQQACIYEWDSNCKGFEMCDIVPNNVPFKDEANCQQYYECIKGVLTSFICENGYFDVNDGCVERSQVECLKHPVPINVCGTVKRPIQNKFVNDLVTCRGYYYCQDRGEFVPDLEPSWGQCPEDRFFEYSIQACYPAAAVNCVSDRCDGRTRNKVISGTKGCQHYLICEDGVTVSEEKCPDGLYFNDDTMECTTTYVDYIACA